VRAVYDDTTGALRSLEVAGKPVEAGATYTVALQGYHVASCDTYLDVSREELEAAGPSKVVTTSAKQVMEEWLRGHQNETRSVEGRLTYV
jgi:hypothetical protein